MYWPHPLVQVPGQSGSCAFNVIVTTPSGATAVVEAEKLSTIGAWLARI
jgi:hypothetical protein